MNDPADLTALAQDAAGNRRRTWALVEVTALVGLTWPVLGSPDGPVVVRDGQIQLALAAFGAATFVVASAVVLGAFVSRGKRRDLLLAAGFLSLACGSAVALLDGLASTDGWVGGVSWSLWLALSAAFFAWAVRVPECRTRAAMKRALVFLAPLVGLVCADAAWTLTASRVSGNSVPAGLSALTAAALYFVAAGTVWRARHRSAASVDAAFAYLLCLLGFMSVQYGVHPYRTAVTELADLLYAGGLSGMIVLLWLWNVRNSRALAARTLEGVLVRQLSPGSGDADTSALIGRICRAAAEALDASTRIVLSEAEDTGGEMIADGRSLRGMNGDAVPLVRVHAESRTISMTTHLGTARGRLGSLIATRPATHAFSDTDRRLLRVAAAQASLLLERSMLREEVAAAAVVEERSRLAREVHDGLAQHLAFLKMRVAWLRRSGAPIASDALEDVQTVLERALADARQAITTLRAEPDGTSTAEVIAAYASEFGQISGLAVQIVHDATVPEVGPKARVELLRIVQEAMNNARKHASPSRIEIEVRSRGRGIEITVRDDGAGFAVGTAEGGHYGLHIMRERAESIGGHFEVLSGPGGGTRIRVWAPSLEAPAGSDRQVG